MRVISQLLPRFATLYIIMVNGHWSVRFSVYKQRVSGQPADYYIKCGVWIQDPDKCIVTEHSRVRHSHARDNNIIRSDWSDSFKSS